MGKGTTWGMTLGRATDWRDYAACSLETARMFELGPRRPNSPIRLSVDNRAALELCRACPVQTQCLNAALAEHDQWPRIAGGQVIEGQRVHTETTPIGCRRPGHEWSDPANVRVRQNGRQVCAACDRERSRAYHRAQRRAT